MLPDFQIITQRLQLRLLKLEEAEVFSDCIRRSPTLHQWVDWCHEDFSKKDAEQFILANRLNWVKADAYGFAVFDKHKEKLVGMVAINEFYRVFNMASLGYWIADDSQHKGFGKEAVDALIEFCFSKLKLTRIEIVCAPENIPSQKLALACGALKEHIARNRFLFNDQPTDGVVFSLIPD